MKSLFHHVRLVPAACAAILALGQPAAAKTPKSLGHWTIAEAQTAPWATSPDQVDPHEIARLKGRTIDFAAGHITGPSPLACPDPHYKFGRYPADYLFQGTLPSPERDAAALGFKDKAIRTLETGCEGLIDFHFIDDATAMFALNNVLYTIRLKR